MHQEHPAGRARLTYAFDAYCGWCYGFAPALHEFAAANADRIELEVLSGGLFTGPRALPASAFPHIPGANARIAELTGVAFGAGYRRMLAEGTVVMDSADA
ncbi:DsbA family protein, partial [Streptomyces sp. S6]